MGKPTGFMEYTREDNNTIPALERIKNYKEFHTPIQPEERRLQGARCMNCGVPMCQSAIRLAGMVTGCPLHNLIPEWNDEISTGNDLMALYRLLKTNNFPEFTGRVCPALCEKACICSQYESPVTVHDNELYIIESAFARGDMQPHIPPVRSGKTVAVVGSGPAGLAVADMLNHRGHNVVVYERDDRVGGLLMYGIPNMKLDKAVIDRRVSLMQAEGATFLTGQDVGGAVSAKELMDQYDAVALCCGSKQPRDLKVPGRETEGVYFAVDFLKSTTKSLLDHNLQDGTFISAKDKHVVVVGGGDTGNDCVGTCIRHGCRSMIQLEMMPCPPTERAENNPWPQWPKVLKTDYGQEESIAVFGADPRKYCTTVKEMISKDGKLCAVKTVQLTWEKENGRMKMQEVPGSEETIPCELLLIAAGFVGTESYITDAFGVTCTQRQTVQTSSADDYHTDVDGVFVAGDMHRGQSLVVWAIAEGRACARQIDEYLMGYTNMSAN